MMGVIHRLSQQTWTVSAQLRMFQSDHHVTVVGTVVGTVLVTVVGTVLVTVVGTVLGTVVVTVLVIGHSQWW